MMRQLEQNELAMIAGGANDVVEIYPPLLQGYEIIGFSQTLLGWNEDTFAERIGYFDTKYTVVRTPVYDIQPIYAPLMPVTTVTYY